MIKPKILVVDNDRDMCWLIASILKEENLYVDMAYDVKSALVKINRYKYEVMILDYKLSGMSGLTILEKAHQIKSPIITIMISAFGDEYVRVKAKELGAYAFLDKPFNIDGLKKIVKKALTEKKRKYINEASRNIKLSCSVYSEHFGSSSFCSREGSSNTLEKSAKKINIPEILKKEGIGLYLNDLITEIIFFVIVVVTLITALQFYGVTTAVFTSQVLAYIPQLIASVFILVIGILLRDKSNDFILAGLVLSFALSFGLKSKEKAEKFLNKIFKK